MNPTGDCPDESVLLALAAGNAATPEVRSHVDACPSCRRPFQRLKDEVDHLRSTVEPESPPPHPRHFPSLDGPLRSHLAGD
jgi:anti-sigma factor ChrR (cupin superfamily)